MYKQPSYFEEEKISLKNNKIVFFCIAIALATVVIVVVTGVLAYRLIKDDFGAENEQIAGSKTVGKTNSPTGEVVPEKTEVPEMTSKPQQMTQNVAFPKHDFSAAMESQLPQYSEEIAKKVVNVYFEETKKVYLTFDDGPTKTITPKVLDILEEEDVKATFFVIGKSVESYPEIVKRAYEEGHYIANHGYSHDNNKLYKSEESFINEIEKTDEAIGKAIGIENYSSHIFRFPNGFMSPLYKSKKKKMANLLTEMGYTYIDWNSLNNDSIKKYTKDEFSHVSISLDVDLNEMYSFGRLNPYNAFWGGFVHEYIDKGTFKRFYNTNAKIYSLEITEEKYSASLIASASDLATT